MLRERDSEDCARQVGVVDDKNGMGEASGGSLNKKIVPGLVEAHACRQLLRL
jgi:hypothetical protein